MFSGPLVKAVRFFYICNGISLSNFFYADPGHVVKFGRDY